MSLVKNSQANTLAEFGSHKIRNGMVVFTLGNSKEVVDTLLEAKKKTINFEVNVIETGPDFSGRKTAQTLAKNGIHVNYYPDTEMGTAIKNADLILLGCGAVTKQGVVYAGLGSEQAADLGMSHDVPLYFCTLSKNVGQDAVKKYEKARAISKSKIISSAKIKVSNNKYEIIHPKHTTGIISEHGILNIHHFIAEAERNNKRLFFL